MSKWWKTKQSDEDNAGDLAEHYRATIRSACKLVEAGARVAVTVDSSFNINCGIPGPHGELQETGLTLFINYGVDGHVPTMELSSQLLSQWLKDLLREIKMSRKGPHLAQHGYACAASGVAVLSAFWVNLTPAEKHAVGGARQLEIWERIAAKREEG